GPIPTSICIRHPFLQSTALQRSRPLVGRASMATPALPKSTIRAAEPADRIPWGQQHIPRLGRNPPAASNATDRCLLHYRVIGHAFHASRSVFTQPSSDALCGATGGLRLLPAPDATDCDDWQWPNL